MATPVLMPKQGNSVEECIIVAWNKKVGEEIAEGEVLAEIETDKASFVVEAPASGKVLGYFFQEGELAPVLVNIAVIGSDGEDIEEFRPKVEESAAAAAPAPSGAPAAPAAAAASATTASAPAAADAPAASAPAVEEAPGGVSPRARRYARRFNIDVSSVKGSGVRGRVVEKDVIASRYALPRHTDLAAKMLADGWELKSSPRGDTVRSSDLRKGEPLSNVRKVIAQRMSESLKNHAQLTLNSSADATKLLQCRAKIKAQKGTPGYVNVTVGDLILLAVIKALGDFPELNVEYLNGKIYKSDSVNVGFACDTDKGLLVPVLAEAEKMSLQDISRTVKTLANAAIGGSINPDNLEGGSFTVSNLGSFGVETFTPILNAPQVAILGVCAPVLRPVRENGDIVYKDYLGLSLTIDHQIIDGAPGARFLMQVKENIQNIDSIAGIEC